MGLFRNIERVLQDVLPVAAAFAPVFIPGPGGAFAGAGLSILNSAIQNPVQRAGAAIVTARAQCPTMGVVGNSFGSPFQSAFFSSGGSLPGRGLGSGFVGRSVIGRPGVSVGQSGGQQLIGGQSGCCPQTSCGPQFAPVVTRFAQPVNPVKALVDPRVQPRFQSRLSPEAFVQSSPVPTVFNAPGSFAARLATVRPVTSVSSPGAFTSRLTQVQQSINQFEPGVRSFSLPGAG